MKHASKYRAFSLAAAAGVAMTMLTAMPVTAADQTGKDVSTCDYVITYDGGKTLGKGDGLIEISLGDAGIPATDVVSEVWVNYTADASKGLPTMPAFGYSAPGCGDYDWYSDGLWMDEPTSNFTVVFPTSEEYPMSSSFQLQLWGEDGTLDSLTVNSIGINTGTKDNLGVMTRKGDVNDDKTVNVADAVAFQKFLLTGEYLTAPANGDLDRNNKLNAIDLTLLKRGLMNGDFENSSNDITAMEFVSNLKLGWNLGNTLDSTVSNYTSPTAAETAWGCPFTTKAMIDTVKNAGFNFVRVPVTWGEKCSGSDFTIDSAWMNRVQEIVDYVIDNDMYCIINIHHDNEQRSNNAYFYPDQSHYDNSIKFITSVWTQVANRFEGYSDHLIFETLNEPRMVGTSYEWNGGNTESRSIVNDYNAAALNAIRATGGNNEKRFVMMPTYAASVEQAAINDMVLPDDDHLIVDLHGYAPWDFALNRTGTDQWNEGSGSYDIVSIFEKAKSKFLNNGIPVIIGEFGALNKENESTRATWAKYYVSTAKSYGVPCCWWDNNQFFDSRYQDGEAFGLIDRNSNSVKYTQIMAAMNEAIGN